MAELARERLASFLDDLPKKKLTRRKKPKLDKPVKTKPVKVEPVAQTEGRAPRSWEDEV